MDTFIYFRNDTSHQKLIIQAQNATIEQVNLNQKTFIPEATQVEAFLPPDQYELTLMLYVEGTNYYLTDCIDLHKNDTIIVGFPSDKHLVLNGKEWAKFDDIGDGQQSCLTDWRPMNMEDWLSLFRTMKVHLYDFEADPNEGIALSDLDAGIKHFLRSEYIFAGYHIEGSPYQWGYSNNILFLELPNEQEDRPLHCYCVKHID